MPMLAAEMASTAANPARTLARMRKVGNFSHCGQTRPDIPTLKPPSFFKTARSRARSTRYRRRKTRAEWIKVSQFPDGCESRPDSGDRPLPEKVTGASRAAQQAQGQSRQKS